jgi:hypothetical protein
MIADGDALGGARQTIELVEGETALWDPTLGRGLVISGRVVDESDRALAGWSVRARSTRVAFPDNSESEANAWPPEWGRTKTDDAGRFILCNLFAGEWTIDVLGPGPDAHAEFVASSPPMENVVIRVHAADAPTSSVRGVVVDEAQLPLGGALVELIPESLALPTLQATTHATTGAFEFKAAASGSYRLRVSAPAFVEFETKQHEIAMGEVKDFEIISLQRSGSLVVRLARVGGAPVGSVGVWLTGLHDTSQLSVPLERDVARSNQLAPGSYTLFVQGEDGRAISTAREVEIRSGERTELEIELARD